MSGGVTIAEKIIIPKTKNFLFFLSWFTLRILSFVNTINKMGKRNDNPLANNKFIVSFIYSEYFDSNSTFNEPSNKFSNDKKKFQTTGIKKK